MKTIIRLALMPLLIAAALPAGAQTDVTGYSLLQDLYVGSTDSIPHIREINGGTVFKVSYGSGWTNDMKGAFEYACKLWEECLPPCLPITVKVETGNLHSSNTKRVMSKVAVPYYDYNYSDPVGMGSTLSSPVQIKAVVLSEMVNSSYHNFIDSISDISFFDRPDVPDINITYDSSFLNACSFSLDDTPVDKYDFVTIALRDIAKGLGFNCDIQLDASDETKLERSRHPTPFEAVVWRSIGTSDLSKALQNATSGSVTVNTNASSYGNISLYAPPTWVDGVSLNYMMPDSTKNLTLLLTPYLGRGQIIRNITDAYYDDLFNMTLMWYGDKLTGMGGGNSVSTLESSTEDVIPYDDEYTITYNGFGSRSVKNDCYTDSVVHTPAKALNSSEIYDYCRKFHPGYNDDGVVSNRCGWLVSILKKDGTWDLVSRLDDYSIPVRLKISELEFHYPESDYSRTCDGYLRCRVTMVKDASGSYYSRLSYISRYYVVDFKPQKVEQKYRGINAGDALTLSSVDASESTQSTSDNLTTVRVDLKNLEGATQVIVEMLEEGHRVPSRFVVDDFKKGYFTAEVVKNTTTQFTVISCNANGSTRSDTISVKPVIALKPDPGVIVAGDTLTVTNPGGDEDAVMSYTVASLSSIPESSPISGQISQAGGTIDISSLSGGLHVITFGIDGQTASVKFLNPD